MMLMVWSSHDVVVAADVIVMPRSCSCGIPSMARAYVVDFTDLVVVVDFTDLVVDA